MPDIIKLLPDSVANQIAAGEVIQRPASVVKELVENSVDAGAGNIKVIIKDAGKTLIQVIDDGIGMSETDARLAFERHATSKITTANDLFAITTKGFRGEALASIAAVAMVELRTRREEDDAGTLIVINGSRVEAQEICSCPAGSNFSVKSLFFNIPARRKFLKSDNTEIRHIIGEFQKLALAHPSIKFSLYHNDTEIYNLPEGNLRQRVIGVFGKPIGQNLISLDTATTIIKITGFIGKPENARRSSGEQFFFVNNRFMKHPYFHKAVMEAYHNILPPDTIPSYFIFLEVDPARIDINIHPTKTEVKFEDERAIWQIIMASSREALGRFNIAPSIDFENEALIDIPVISSRKGDLPEPPKIEINHGYNPFAGDEFYNPGNIVEKFEKARISNWDKLYPPDRGSGKLTGSENIADDINRKIFQIKERYLVAPVRSGLMIIDQKRAHERVLYEKYLEMLTKPVGAESQTSMFPETLELTPGDYFILGEIKDELVKCGFDIQELGNNVVSLRTFPASVGDIKPAALLESIIREYREKQTDPSIGITGKVALSLARSSAIPYGKKLSRSEMEDLFDSLFACSSPNYSPAGKPVISIITLEEIDKRLK
jgi:DNA mismatch repair protein MutL